MPEKQTRLGDGTRVPIKWVFALLVGCASFTTIAVTVAMYFGARDANGADLVRRVTKLEQDVTVISVVDRRLFRLEIKMGVDVPASDRLPAADSGR